MLKRCKSNINYFSAGLTVLLILIITFDMQARDKKLLPFFKSLTEYADTAAPRKKSKQIKTVNTRNTVDSLIIKDTVLKSVPDTS